MRDLIDRQALLKQIDIDSDGEPGYYGDTWKFIDTIKNMPNVHDLPKDADTISRQAAIEAVESMLRRKFGIGGDLAEITLAGLPSAQPDAPDTNVGDIISRQAACEYCHEDSDGYVMPLEKNSHAFIRFGMDGWEIDLNARGWHGSAKIRFCPMCGRELGHG